MNVLDDLFSSKREEQYRNGATALEERLLKFQKHLEERFKSEFKLEVNQFVAIIHLHSIYLTLYHIVSPKEKGF